MARRSGAFFSPISSIWHRLVRVGQAIATYNFFCKPEAEIEELRTEAPLERLGQPEDIANVVSFLAGPDGGWLNGQVLRANGGFAFFA
jgi:NAD(P)-dependent dehydrogenase (short-subunit alcohol dehydrogenase family)